MCNLKKVHNFFSIEKKNLFIIFFISYLFTGSGCKSVDSPKEFSMIKAQGNLKASSLSSKYVLGVGDQLLISFFRKPSKLQKEYRIKVNDEIKIDFTYYKELSTKIVVPPDGRIVLKKIGEIKIVNLTTKELMELLKKLYARILTQPEIVATLVKFYSPTDEFFATFKQDFGGRNTEVLIRSDGKISLPLINDIRAEGLTPLELMTNMQSLYNELIPELEVTVVVKKEESKKILVLGEVQKEGLYQLFPWNTVLDAISFSGGHTDRAYLKEVLVLRRGEKGNSETIFIDVKKSLSRRVLKRFWDKDSKFSRRFYLKPYDIVYVPKKPIVNLTIALKQIYEIVPSFVSVGFGYDLHPQTTAGITVRGD